MIGAPPGYIGYEQGGALTEAVRRQPYSVVLFDEIEKAHPEVFNALLQLLDDGRLTDGQGRTVDFTNTVVILTSNIGTRYFDAGSGFTEAARRERVMEELRANFRPEFLNRIDEIVLFHALTREQIRRILDLQLAEIERHLGPKRIRLTLEPKVKETLAERGYDPDLGARPLRRLVQREIQNPLAMKLLAGEIHEGDAVTVGIDAQSALTWSVVAEPEVVG
jgi:ATP-dependent Clp protease ATP-binding subunit ClpB